MRNTLFLLIAVFLLGYVCPAQAAGQLIPPVGNASGKCPSNQVLAWVGSSLKCEDPTPGTSVAPACPTGQGYQKIVNGKGTCIKTKFPTISCPSKNAVQTIINGEAICVDIKKTASVTVSCGAGKAIQKLAGDVAVCVDVEGSSTTVSCGAGKAIQKITNGVVTCAEIGTAGPALTASCPTGKILQKIVNGAPVCVAFATAMPVTASCSTRTVIKGIKADGSPICTSITPWIGGQFTVWGKTTTSPCFIPNFGAGGCKCVDGYHPVESWRFWNPAGAAGFYCSTSYTNCYATQYTCYANYH